MVGKEREGNEGRAHEADIFPYLLVFAHTAPSQSQQNQIKSNQAHSVNPGPNPYAVSYLQTKKVGTNYINGRGDKPNGNHAAQVPRASENQFNPGPNPYAVNYLQKKRLEQTISTRKKRRKKGK